MNNLNFTGLIEFLEYEVLISLTPILLSWGIHFIGTKIGWFQPKKALEFLGEAELMSWSLPITSLAIWRISSTKLQFGFIFLLGIVTIIFSSAGYILSSIIRFRFPDDQELLPETKKYLGGFSLTIVLITIIIGGLIILNINE